MNEGLEFSEEMLGLVLTMGKLDPDQEDLTWPEDCLLYTSPSPRD